MQGVEEEGDADGAGVETAAWRDPVGWMVRYQAVQRGFELFVGVAPREWGIVLEVARTTCTCSWCIAGRRWCSHVDDGGRERE